MKCDIRRQLQLGTRVEMEHHLGRKMARKIAYDHIREYPCYYPSLLKMERGLSRKK